MAKKTEKKDTNQLAKGIVDILTGDKPKPKKKKELVKIPAMPGKKS